MLAGVREMASNCQSISYKALQSSLLDLGAVVDINFVDGKRFCNNISITCIDIMNIIHWPIRSTRRRRDGVNRLDEGEEGIVISASYKFHFMIIWCKK